MISIDKETFMNMVDSDKIVSLNSLVEHTDMSVLKNIAHITGGPSSIASTGKTICYPNKIIPKVSHKTPKIKRSKLFFSLTGESKFSTKNFEKNSDQMNKTKGEKFNNLIALVGVMNIVIIIVIVAIIILIVKNILIYFFFHN